MSHIVINALSKSFGEKKVLDCFSAVFPEGEVTCIMGQSGCGKTTLLNILMGLLSADSGTIQGLPGRISAVFQEDRLCEDFSALRNVRLVTGKAVSDGQIIDCLEALGLVGSLNCPVRELSGGMKRRVAIARALLAGGELLILDEPFKGLDEDTRRNAAAQILHRAEGRTIIMVTHDPDEAQLTGGKITEMRVLT